MEGNQHSFNYIGGDSFITSDDLREGGSTMFHVFLKGVEVVLIVLKEDLKNAQS